MGVIVSGEIAFLESGVTTFVISVVFSILSCPFFQLSMESDTERMEIEDLGKICFAD